MGRKKKQEAEKVIEETHQEVGYSNHICHFCGGRDAAYGRDDKGKTESACFKCAKAKFKGGE